MTRPAKLPGLNPVATGNPALDSLLRGLIERSEVREGSRGSPDERVVTHREMKALGLDAEQIGTAGLSSSVRGGSRGGVMVQSPSGSFTRVPYDAFADELRKTTLYRDLMASINSVTRFDGVPQEVRSLLLSSLADEAAQWGAEIRRLDKKIQSETESLAYTVETITAAVSGAAAGVREVSFASANANVATAGRITQVTARLDGVGGVGVEAAMTAVADRATGLEGKYAVKVNAGGAVAGFGLAASENLAGATTSAFVVQANKFALTSAPDFSQEATPSAAAAGKTWYKPSTDVFYRSTAAGTGSWAIYTPVIPFGVDMATNTTYINGQVRINAGGPTILDGIKGDPGTAGARGSLTGYGKNYSIYVASWADGAATTGAYLANRVIDNMLTGGTATTALTTDTHLRIGDTITLTNAAAATTATTKYWSGSSWVAPGVIIDGNLLASGVITAGISLNTGGFLKAAGQTSSANLAGQTFSGVFNDSAGASVGAIGVSGSSGVGMIGYGGPGFTTGVYAVSGPTSTGNALETLGKSKLAGNVDITGNLTVSGTVNATTLDGYDNTDFARYITVAAGSPGTAFTHVVTLQLGTTGTQIRIPCFIP
jgi:hypothetical protein